MSDWTGVLELDVENRKGRTVAGNIYFQGAFKIMRPVYLNNYSHPCFYLLNPGGGYLDGDTYRMKVTLAEDAMLTLTTQSSTKVYKTPESYAYQETEFHLQKGSYLEYLPDPLIAYEDAKYVQENIVHMEKGSTLLYSDIVTPGWSPEGTKFSYDILRLKSEIYMDGELAIYDHIKLQPEKQDMTGLGFMEGFTHLGSFIVVSEKADDDLIHMLHETVGNMDGDFKFGISRLTIPGFTIRILADKTQQIERIITACHMVISEEWHEAKPSFLRKY